MTTVVKCEEVLRALEIEMRNHDSVCSNRYCVNRQELEFEANALRFIVSRKGNEPYAVYEEFQLLQVQ